MRLIVAAETVLPIAVAPAVAGAGSLYCTEPTIVRAGDGPSSGKTWYAYQPPAGPLTVI